MASARKCQYWREAASLILTTSKANGRPPKATANILETSTKYDASNFDVLMLKRSNKSSFMANVYVFPGGVVSDADFNGKGWSSIFERNTGTSMGTIMRDFHIQGPRAPMMQSCISGDVNYLAPDITFRICAIRETFEESGVLLVSHKSEFKNVSNRDRRINVPKVSKLPRSFDTQMWRAKVSSDADAFLDLCTQNDVVPNIWSLFEWSNWLTPVFVKVEKPPKKPKRFDTIFYVCCLDSYDVVRNTMAESEEISQMEWNSPDTWYSRGQSKEITLVGPQFYETSRLTGFSESRDLLAYAQQREPLGMERWMSVSFICDDGIFFTLPGDEMYPAKPDYEGIEDIAELSGSVLSHCHQARRYHRGIRGSWRYFCNITLPYGLITQRFAEVNFPEHFDFLESKL